MKRIARVILLVFTLAVVMAGCGQGSDNQAGDQPGRVKVVATTTMLADLARVIGGPYVEVYGLMGPGIDPHLYKASAGDVTRLQQADLVLSSGLHLEGKMGDIFDRLGKRGKQVVVAADGVNTADLLQADDDAAVYDPHIWFDVQLWKGAARELTRGLQKLDSAHAEEYEHNLTAYLLELDDLHEYILQRAAQVPPQSRVLITAHDAFGYFGRAYGFEVRGLQGLSTVAEAGTSDIRQLADFIVERQIKAVFVESSVPRKTVEALQEAVRARNFSLQIGGELYSDSLGGAGSGAETYTGTLKKNIDTIVDALK